MAGDPALFGLAFLQLLEQQGETKPGQAAWAKATYASKRGRKLREEGEGQEGRAGGEPGA